MCFEQGHIVLDAAFLMCCQQMMMSVLQPGGEEDLPQLLYPEYDIDDDEVGVF